MGSVAAGYGRVISPDRGLDLFMSLLETCISYSN